MAAVPNNSSMKRLTVFVLGALAAAGWLSGGDAPVAPTPADANAETAALPELSGVLLERPDGGVLQLTMEQNAFVLHFYNAKHEAVPPDVDRATIRLVPAGRKPERVVLIPTSDGMALTHGRPIRAPHVFKIFLNLFRGDSENAVEDYTTSYP